MIQWRRRRGKKNIPLGNIIGALTSTLWVVDLGPINALPSTAAMLERAQARTKKCQAYPLGGPYSVGAAEATAIMAAAAAIVNFMLMIVVEGLLLGESCYGLS